MSAAKDDEAIVKFMVLFHRLRDMIDDDPVGLEALANADESLKRLCLDLDFAATTISMTERQHPELFAAPVDPKFIAAWRSYTERYASPLAGIFLADIGIDALELPRSRQDAFALKWEYADQDAKERADAIASAIEWAREDMANSGEYYPETFVENIEAGAREWRKLGSEMGFRLRDVFRRRALVPFVLIPRHVSSHYGETEKLSLLSHLKQAHDAFVFGIPFAAVALMRSILEVVLRDHYSAMGKTLDELVDNSKNLPAGAQRQALHRLRKRANDILHLNVERTGLPPDMDREVLSLLSALRSLIEGAPGHRA